MVDLDSLNNEKFDDELDILLRTGKALKGEGYDTVVILPFDNSQRCYPEVKQQLESIGEEVLLFVQYVNELTVSIPGESRTWIADRQKDQVLVGFKNGEPDIWTIYTDEDKIPPDLLTDDIISTPEFQIKIAVSDKLRSTQKLFAYLPTEVRFPYPVIVHATMEVTNNRQNLTDTPANHFLAKRIAKSLVQVAERNCTSTDLWRGISILSRNGDLDPLFDKFGFGDSLIDEAKGAKNRSYSWSEFCHR